MAVTCCLCIKVIHTFFLQQHWWPRSDSNSQIKNRQLKLILSKFGVLLINTVEHCLQSVRFVCLESYICSSGQSSPSLEVFLAQKGWTFVQEESQQCFLPTQANFPSHQCRNRNLVYNLVIIFLQRKSDRDDCSGWAQSHSYIAMFVCLVRRSDRALLYNSGFHRALD